MSKTSKQTNQENYSYTFQTSMNTDKVFEILVNVREWWTGIYGETIKGESSKLNDQFTYKAGEGAHYSEQKVVELKPNQSIAWLVTKSNLTFLSDPTEWEQTIIRFDLSRNGDGTDVTFTHVGLAPQIECYKACSAGWTGYLNNLRKKLEGV